MPIYERIVIDCQCTPCHDWMAFASWYSFRKMLPDVPACVRVVLDRPMFAWVPRLASRARSAEESDLVVAPTVMAVRDFCGDWAISPARSSEQTCLVDYSGGCGNFVVGKWINTDRHPFHRASARFGAASMTVNEVAVLKMWERCESLYRAAGV